MSGVVTFLKDGSIITHGLVGDSFVKAAYRDKVQELYNTIDTLQLELDNEVAYKNRCTDQLEYLTRMNNDMKDQLSKANKHLEDLFVFEDYSNDKEDQFKITYPFPGFDKLRVEYIFSDKIRVCAINEHKTVERTFNIPSNSNIDSIEVRFKNGLLTIVVPTGKSIPLKIIE